MGEIRELTFKQREFVKLYLELGNATEAAMRIYDCKDRDVAKTIGWENLTKLDLGYLMEEAGLSNAKLMQTHLEGLQAQRVISAMNTGKEASGATSDFIEVPDYAVRHKYLELAYKLKKYLVEKTEVTGLNGQPIMFEFSYGKAYIPPTGEVKDAPMGSANEQPASLPSASLAQKG